MMGKGYKVPRQFENTVTMKLADYDSMVESHRRLHDETAEAYVRRSDQLAVAQKRIVQLEKELDDARGHNP